MFYCFAGLGVFSLKKKLELNHTDGMVSHF